MVELRSGRHAGPNETVLNTAKSTSRRLKTKNEKSAITPRPTKIVQASRESSAEESIGDTIVVSSGKSRETASSLPHRSRTLNKHNLDTDREEPDIETPISVSGASKNVTPSESNSDQTVVLNPTSSLLRTPKAKRKNMDSVEIPTQKLKAMPKATHKRFDSEEPDIEESFVTARDSISSPALEEQESDDDAPEEVTAAAGAQQAKAATAKAAQFIKDQEEAEKAKRRRRNEELAAQAQVSRKRKAESVPSPETQRDSITDSVLASTLKEDDGLPDELPDEILAIETKTKPQLTNAIPRSSKLLNKRKRLDQEAKPVRDLQVGDMNVRVLSKPAKLLPPPVSKASANVRQLWLKNRAAESHNKIAGYRTKGAGARVFVRR